MNRKMNRNQHGLVVILVILAALVGAVSDRLFPDTSALASEIGMASKEGPPPNNIIRAQGLELTDKTGKVRAKFVLAPDGKPSLLLYDPKGSVSLSAAVGGDGNPVFGLRGKGGTNMTLAIRSDGSPVFAMRDKKGKLRCILRLAPDGSPVLGLQDENGIARAVLGSMSGKVADRVPSTRPVSSLVLFDENEKVVWQAP